MSDLRDLDFDRLTRLRGRFLEADDFAGPVADYWSDDDDLAAYDAVFAERIGWKWDAVLDELVERAFARADQALVVDWGCGTGIAARRFVARFGAGAVRLHDRSARARLFAASRLRAAHRQLDIGDLEPGTQPDVLLISHVLNELDPASELALLELVERSRRVIWVEPGTHAVSRRLSMLRDLLRGRFTIVAPCTHQERCGALAGEDRRDWCHFFASPPAAVFQDGDWVRLARRLGIDLRALPYAFLALSGGDCHNAIGARLLGRPKVGKVEARIHLCDVDGVQLVHIAKRSLPDLFRALRKHGNELRRLVVDRDGDRVSDWRPEPG